MLTTLTLTASLLFGLPADPPDASSPELDPRIDGSKITESAPPPLPETVMLPLPPDHRIADRAAQVPISAEHWARGVAAIERGIAALAEMQADDGSWMGDISVAPTDDPDMPSPVAVAVTALATKAALQTPQYDGPRPSVERAFDYIAKTRRDDGAFEGGALTNYVTSTVASALAAVPSRTAREQLLRTTQWLETSQWDAGEGLSAEQDWYGGSGYGKHGRPDLSNTQMMLEALYDAGKSPSEPAFERALAFVSRTQNLSATNKAAWAGNDGGFIYTPANGGESMGSQYAGEGRYGENLPEGAVRSLRSYGSMTYAGFKSLLYAGLSTDDIRVRAAYDWIRHHWTFSENPGVGQQGLFYYYHAMARALRVAQQHTVIDGDDVPHNWREELIDAICERQRSDGTWVNSEDRWLENQPALVTAYAVLALQEALKPVTFD